MTEAAKLMRSPEYPIKDYAIIGNCETAALINSDGGIDWLCLPAFDGPSFFGALLDREKGGDFFIHPAKPYRVERIYLAESAILQTRFLTESYSIVLTDFFVIARKRSARFYDFTSLQQTQKLVRMVHLEKGERAAMELHLAARPDYGRARPQWQSNGAGFVCADASVFSNIPLAENAGDLSAKFDVDLAKKYFVVLDYSDNPVVPDLAAVERWLETTKAFWEEWDLFNYYRGPHRDVVRRSAVTLKLLTYAPTGAIVAAPTTSLPEKIGGDGNWDYRFSWVRDTALFINTFFRIGYSGEAKAFFNFICRKHTEQKNDKIPVLLAIRDQTRVEQETLDHLCGYRESRPVRRGNHATDQIQLDNYGHLLQSLFFWQTTGGKIAGAKMEMAKAALAGVRRDWSKPDNGIWEKSERHQHTFGKVSAWLALQRGRDLGLIDKEEAEELSKKISADVRQHGIFATDSKRFLADTYEDARVDASALLAFTSGFLPEANACDTRKQIEEKLAEPPWLYRSELYRATGEGAFLLCTFWWIDHLIREGELARAEDLLERVIASANSLGLYSEEIDPSSGEFLGNFPQAFSHLGLIAAILNLEQAKRDHRFASLPDHEKFKASVGVTVGFRGVIAGFFRVPKTLRLLFSSRSKWR